MHKIIDADSILTTVEKSLDHSVIIASGAWGDRFMTHFFDNIQKNHKLCRDKSGVNYEYVFYTTYKDYEKYKNKFIDEDIIFILTDIPHHLGGMNGVQIDYAHKRSLPLILFASDCLHTTNLIPNIMSKYKDKEVLCVMSQRIYSEVLKDINKEEIYEDIFEPRKFLKLCLPYLHQRERRYFMDSYRATGTYGSLMFPVRKDSILIGILIRSFHLGIIYIKSSLGGLTGGYLDSNPFVSKQASTETIGMITDSDDGFCVDISFDRNDNGEDDCPILQDLNQITVYRQGWLGHAVFPTNESLMGYNIAVHSESLNEEWIKLANSANEFVTKIYEGKIKNKSIDWRMME